MNRYRTEMFPVPHLRPASYPDRHRTLTGSEFTTPMRIGCDPRAIVDEG
jgi:hypothetical protein